MVEGLTEHLHRLTQETSVCNESRILMAGLWKTPRAAKARTLPLALLLHPMRAEPGFSAKAEGMDATRGLGEPRRWWPPRGRRRRRLGCGRYIVPVRN